LLCVIPFCPDDADAALDLVRWVGELGGSKEHDCVLMAAVQVADEVIGPIVEAALLAFRDVVVQKTPYMLRNEKWPIGPNWMFQVTLLALRDDPRPFFWLEPDCFPLKPGWLDAIEEEYRTSGKPFMGRIQAQQGRSDSPHWCPEHLTGCAVYPPGADNLLLEYTSRSAPWDPMLPWAWDVACHEVAVPNTHDTNLQYHAWGREGLPPTYVEAVTDQSPRHVIAMSAIPESAVLGHRCKDGSAIACLRKRLEVPA